MLVKSQQENQSLTEFPFILTDRERAILDSFATGMSLSSVVRGLGISDAMVTAHTNNILQKVHFVDIAQKQYDETKSDLSSFRSLSEYS